ncbi:MAG: hypothetical protein IJJ16_07325 [Mogibacterium sp.]|nr:hypothetical protein [Mogibacterium sp.]
MNNKRSIAFTVELLGLFILLMMVIVMVTQVFVMSRAKTVEARRLTQAVMIAQSTAEAASSERDPELLAETFSGMDNVLSAEYDDSNGSIDIVFDTNGVPDDEDYRVVLHRASEDRGNGVYVTDSIEVYYCAPDKLEGMIYDLETGRHFAGEEAGS